VKEKVQNHTSIDCILVFCLEATDNGSVVTSSTDIYMVPSTVNTCRI